MCNGYVLTVSDLSFSYGRKKALQNVAFEVKKGECNILLGPNGAGKSTLFSLITRLYDSRQGKIEICDYDVRKQTRLGLAKLGVVFQQTTLDLDLTVLQNLRYHSALHGLGRKIRNRRIEEELKRFDMFQRRHEKVRQLNGGHRRRVEIARALLHKPDLLLLDEPTVGLDVPSREAIVSHVHQLAGSERLAVLWATHLMDEIDVNQDRLIVLHQGSVQAKGSVSEVLQSTQAESVHQAFQILTNKGGVS